MYKSFCAYYFRKGNILQFIIITISLIISFLLFTSFNGETQKQIKPNTDFVAAIFLAIVGNGIFNLFSVEIPKYKNIKAKRKTLDNSFNEIINDVRNLILKIYKYAGNVDVLNKTGKKPWQFKYDKDEFEQVIDYFYNKTYDTDMNKIADEQSYYLMKEFLWHSDQVLFRVLNTINRLYILDVLSDMELFFIEAYRKSLQEVYSDVSTAHISFDKYNKLFEITHKLIKDFLEYDVKIDDFPLPFFNIEQNKISDSKMKKKKTRTSKQS